jgi:signal peptidase I
MKKTTRVIGLILISAVMAGCDQKSLKQNQKIEQVQQASVSMEPSIMKEETIKADMDAFANAKPGRWDAVVFIQPERHERWISRVVGLPGEIVDVRAKSLFINGSQVPLPAKMGSVVYASKIAGSKISFPYTIPDGSYFILGDNTTKAYDSRFWGALPATEIVGRVLDK